MKNVQKTVASAGRVAMTPEQVERCKAKLRNENRGYNVHPNSFDVANPFRVAINYNNEWANFGNFKSADVAAAVGTIVSMAYFGEKAKAGDYNEAIAESDPAFKEWLGDERNADIIARAEGELPSIHQPHSNAAAARNSSIGF